MFLQAKKQIHNKGLFVWSIKQGKKTEFDRICEYHQLTNNKKKGKSKIKQQKKC